MSSHIKLIFIVSTFLILNCLGSRCRAYQGQHVSPIPQRNITEIRGMDEAEYTSLTEPILVIDEELSPDLLFALIIDIKLLSDGTLVISDLRNHCLFFVSSDGNLITRKGGLGAGPGELTLTSRARLDVSRGDTVSVYDGQNSRISRFNSDGDWIDSFHMTTLLMDFTILDDGTTLLAPFHSPNVLVANRRSSTQADTILLRDDFTDNRRQMPNGWFIEHLGQQIYLYHWISGLLLHSQSINDLFDTVSYQDGGFRRTVRPLLIRFDPSETARELRRRVFINSHTVDVDEECIYIELGDHEIVDYRRIVKLDKELNIIAGWMIPTPMVDRGIAVRKGHLYSYSGTAVYKWF